MLIQSNLIAIKVVFIERINPILIFDSTKKKYATYERIIATQIIISKPIQK